MPTVPPSFFGSNTIGFAAPYKDLEDGVDTLIVVGTSPNPFIEVSFLAQVAHYLVNILIIRSR